MAIYDTKTYTAAVGEHEVAFEFDKSGVIVNRRRLYLDGVEIDKRAVHYGERRSAESCPTAGRSGSSSARASSGS